ncbi:hypothetical protein AB0M46_40920 [Dactylosporangium sp. NPDC051485]|uniref:hypothetical protein n=1 Tax=Dactylosporangium sp. NPDC051485 TaxID=3154846 RepID=UPI003439B77D
MSGTDPAEHLGRELTSVAHGDPGVARALRQALDRLAGGAAGDDLREMADDVLAGRIGLRQAVLSRAYGEHLQTGLRAFTEYLDNLSPQERQDLREAGRARIRQLAEED